MVLLFYRFLLVINLSLFSPGCFTSSSSVFFAQGRSCEKGATQKFINVGEMFKNQVSIDYDYWVSSLYDEKQVSNHQACETKCGNASKCNYYYYRSWLKVFRGWRRRCRLFEKIKVKPGNELEGGNLYHLVKC